jgi:hypothetical protein
MGKAPVGFRTGGKMTRGQVMEKYRQRRTFRRTGAIIFLIMLWCGISACSLDKLYYADKPAPVKAITDTFGSPLWVELQPDGAEKLVYRIRDPLGWNYYHRYFIVKDGKLIGGGIQ